MMNKIFRSVPVEFKLTGQFSEIITDYLSQQGRLDAFYRHRPEIASFSEAIAKKKSVKVNRKLLQGVLTDQYQKIPASERVESDASIKSLADENTFTVTTGHQLCLFTGPLYFIYKIASTIRLAERLRTAFPEYNFVPVYWMASEDHDFDEINHVHLFSKKLIWEQDQKGASGKIPTSSLDKFFEEFKGILGTTNHANELIKLFSHAYVNHTNLADATRYLVHTLFGKYGLLILDPDHKDLKREFMPIMSDDLQNHHAFNLVNETSKKLSEHYKTQVAPREINLFYLTANSRERIIAKGENFFEINNNGQVFTRDQMLEMLHQSPENFSPNVVLRPLYQEQILPDLAYVGGPGEIAYWLQYMAMFDFYKIPFPVLILRNCYMVLDQDNQKKLADLHLEYLDLFMDKDLLVKTFLKNTTSGNEAIHFDVEREELNVLFEKLAGRIAGLDPTLVPFVSGEQQKVLNALHILEQKVLKSEKRKHETALNQLAALKEKLFPASVAQERHYNFSMFFLKYGVDFIDYLINESDPLQLKYKIVLEK